MSEPSGYRVTAYYVCHDWRTAGMVEVTAAGPHPPSGVETERLAVAAAEAAVLRVDAERPARESTWRT